MRAVQVSDEVLRLSPLGVRDVGAHLAGEDPALVRWLHEQQAGTPESVESWVRSCLAQWAAGGPVLEFGIRTGEPEALTGTIGLRFTAPYLKRTEVELKYGLYPAFRGRGLATRAVLLACAYAAERGLQQAVIRTHADNPDSAAVARRAGFTERGLRLDRADGERYRWHVRALG